MRQKRIFNMLNHRLAVPENNGNDIETGVHIQIILENIGIGGSNQHALFPLRHSQIGLAMLVSLSGFHLDDNQILTVLGDNVNLLMDVMPIALQNLVALVGKKLDSQLLA